MTKSRLKEVLAFTVYSAALVAMGFMSGRVFESFRLMPQITASAKFATERDTVALQWKAKAEQAEPLIRQWRMGYEQLRAKCEGGAAAISTGAAWVGNGGTGLGPAPFMSLEAPGFRQKGTVGESAGRGSK